MDIVTGIERLTALAFLLNGLSHLAAPRAWARFFIEMRDERAVPGFAQRLSARPLGLLIAAFHPVWSGPALLVTLLGWGLVLKGTIYFVWPQLAAKSMAHVSEARVGEFQVAGAVSLVIGLYAGWVSFGAPGL